MSVRGMIKWKDDELKEIMKVIDSKWRKMWDSVDRSQINLLPWWQQCEEQTSRIAACCYEMWNTIRNMFSYVKYDAGTLN